MNAEKVLNRPIAGVIENRQVVISSQGRTVVDGREIKGGPDALLQQLGITRDEELTSDDESRGQWGWTRALVGDVVNMILKSDAATRRELFAGEVKIEAVVGRAVGVVEKMIEVQLAYERGRLDISYLDTAQATSEAMRKVLNKADHWWDWNGVPAEMKGIIVKTLEDYRQANAVMLMSQLSPEQVETAIDHIKAIAKAKAEAEAEGAMQKLVVAEKKAEGARTDLRQRNQIQEEKAQADAQNRKQALLKLVDVIANATSRSSDGVKAFVLDVNKGILPMTAEAYKVILEKLKEPKVWGGSTGLAVSVVGSSVVVMAVGLVGAPLAAITIPVVLVASGLAGAGLGVSAAERLSRK